MPIQANRRGPTVKMRSNASVGSRPSGFGAAVRDLHAPDGERGNAIPERPSGTLDCSSGQAPIPCRPFPLTAGGTASHGPLRPAGLVLPHP
jgi:hypothetical protein